MATLQYPKLNVKYYAIQDVYLKADDASVLQYCTERGYILESYTPEIQRFSNDGGIAYQYYGTLLGSDNLDEQWNTEFGFSRVVMELNYIDTNSSDSSFNEPTFVIPNK